MRKAIFALFVVALVGCDSGGSSSGSSVEVTADNTTSSANIGAQFAGTYRGRIEGTYTATEIGLSDSDSTPITIVIQPNGTTTVSAEGRSYTGTLETDRVTAVIDVNETYEGITCTGRINVNARAFGDTISGSADGTGNCSQGSISTPVVVEGSLNASR